MTESNSHKKQMKTFTEKSNQKRFGDREREENSYGNKNGRKYDGIIA